jgi:phage protein U
MIDPIEELREIERLAQQGQEAIRTGSGTTGAYALRKIEERASDAVRWAGKRRVNGREATHA